MRNQRPSRNSRPQRTFKRTGPVQKTLQPAQDCSREDPALLKTEWTGLFSLLKIATILEYRDKQREDKAKLRN